MKVFISPTGLFSRAMLRVEAALKSRAPKDVEIVSTPGEADFRLLHVIGPVADVDIPVGRFGVIQYCGSLIPEAFTQLWQRAEFVWSYYDLTAVMPESTRFLFMPLGVDGQLFSQLKPNAPREVDVMTTGYSTAPGQEAIQEVVEAAVTLHRKYVHIGPKNIEGWRGEFPKDWSPQLNVDDGTMKLLYRNSRYVACLRYTEGFEMPGFEGLVNGARPIVFDREDMRRWYGDHAVYVPEVSGEELKAVICDVLAGPYKPVTPDEVAAVKARFNWDEIAVAVWSNITTLILGHTSVAPMKPRLLWIGDAVAATGFARSTHYVLNTLMDHFDVHVLGLNYYGDPHSYPYEIYPCYSGGDGMGYGRVAGLVGGLQPDIVVIQNDPWHVNDYVTRIRKVMADVPIVGYIAIDGKNALGSALNGLTHAAFWTNFAANEAKLGGYLGTSSVIPLGVDETIYKPRDRRECRNQLGVTPGLLDNGFAPDAFIVGVVGRNQWRKRFDLTFEYFAEFAHQHGKREALLWVHSAPTGDDAWDLLALAKAFGVHDQVMFQQIPRTVFGLAEHSIAMMYAACDVMLTTTLGEGMGLPTLEAAACGTASIVPRWSALGELFEGAAMQVNCSSIAVHTKQTCTIGGVMDKAECVQALEFMFDSPRARLAIGHAAHLRAGQPRFNWDAVGESFNTMLQAVMKGETVGLPLPRV